MGDNDKALAAIQQIEDAYHQAMCYSLSYDVAVYGVKLYPNWPEVVRKAVVSGEDYIKAFQEGYCEWNNNRLKKINNMKACHLFLDAYHPVILRWRLK